MALSRLRSPIGLTENRLRTNEELIGAKDENNIIFDSPEDFSLDLDGGFFFEFFRNGQFQVLGKQYVILSLNGIGIGVKVFRPPRPHEDLRINFITP